MSVILTLYKQTRSPKEDLIRLVPTFGAGLEHHSGGRKDIYQLEAYGLNENQMSIPCLESCETQKVPELLIIRVKGDHLRQGFTLQGMCDVGAQLAHHYLTTFKEAWQKDVELMENDLEQIAEKLGYEAIKPQHPAPAEDLLVYGMQLRHQLSNIGRVYEMGVLRLGMRKHDPTFHK